jgi:hypothetical protein
MKRHTLFVMTSINQPRTGDNRSEVKFEAPSPRFYVYNYGHEHCPGINLLGYLRMSLILSRSQFPFVDNCKRRRRRLLERTVCGAYYALAPLQGRIYLSYHFC